MKDIQTWVEHMKQSVSRVILGKDDVIEKLLITLLCDGHVLLEDVPGVGKTILARALSLCLGGDFKRIQCTPDLLPADILGVSIYNQQNGEFEFKEGPVITNVLLVDEINRATPRTQSALLEAMTEGRISVEGKALILPQPFFMIATENPVEFEGTFPLPEAQRDRFFMCLSMGYPPEEAEEELMIAQRRFTHPVTDLKPVTELDQVRMLQSKVREIPVGPGTAEYILSIVEETRKDSRLQLGASPRASIALYRGGQALAAARGMGKVTVEEIRTLAPFILLKRISLKAEHLLKGLKEENIIEEILEKIPITPAEQPV